MDDIKISRRRLLLGAGCVAATTMFSGIRVSFADAPVEERFVFIILRGAMDGLNAIPPYGDRAYTTARNGIALPATAYTKLDNFFGAHNSFVNFIGMFGSGEAAAIQAVSTPYRERSHFDAQNVLESGATQPHGLNDGWLNRALTLYGRRQNSLGLAVGQTIPLSLQGTTPVGTWAPSARGLPDDTMILSLERLYQHDAMLHTALVQAVDVHGIADGALDGETMGKKGGGKIGNGGGLRGKEQMQATVSAVGKILSDPAGPRIATIELGGWDTHAQQGTEAGVLANNFAALDAGFGALKTSLGEHWKKTVVLAATEFGRTVAQNGTGGTDHGTASCAFLLGGAVNGGKIYSRWPGLGQAQLYQNRDLQPTTDLRQVAKAILTEHLRLPGNEVDANVFPNSGSARALDGIIRT